MYVQLWFLTTHMGSWWDLKKDWFHACKVDTLCSRVLKELHLHHVNINYSTHSNWSCSKRRSPAFDVSQKYNRCDDVLGLGLMLAKLLGPVKLESSSDRLNALLEIVAPTSRIPLWMKDRLKTALEGGLPMIQSPPALVKPWHPMAKDTIDLARWDSDSSFKCKCKTLWYRCIVPLKLLTVSSSFKITFDSVKAQVWRPLCRALQKLMRLDQL